MPGLKVTDKENYLEINTEARYPDTYQWLREDCEWPGEADGAVFPTSMKSIRRTRPPPAPAG